MKIVSKLEKNIGIQTDLTFHLLENIFVFK